MTDWRALQINWSALQFEVIDFKKSKKKSMEAFLIDFEITANNFNRQHRISLVLEPRERAYQRHQRYPVILGVTDWRALQINWSASSVIDFKKSKEKHGSFSNWFFEITAGDFNRQHRISLVLEPRERAYQRHQRYPVILIKDIKVWLTRAPD